ncbi:unnamed protein product [Rotaria magnacalcarata]|uniref:Tetratricopeptide repeat protein n=1 Tax=Rotaria magnacalcarata TaxID=392030 RepID=A0A8S2L7Z2_9BILA|nr:unnamed protein product [Rotaria magnacalcarata]
MSTPCYYYLIQAYTAVCSLRRHLQPVDLNAISFCAEHGEAIRSYLLSMSQLPAYDQINLRFSDEYDPEVAQQTAILAQTFIGIWIGRIYYEYGQLKDALDYLLEAKALYSPADTGKDSPINLYINLGFIECRLVNYYAALDCFGQAFEFIYNQKHNLHCERRIFFTHNRYVYCKLGQVEIAMKNYQKSLSLHKEYHPNHPDFAQVYKNIGLIHEQIDSNYPITLSFYKRALELVPNVKHPHYILYKGMILTLELKQQKEGLIN